MSCAGSSTRCRARRSSSRSRFPARAGRRRSSSRTCPTTTSRSTRSTRHDPANRRIPASSGLDLLAQAFDPASLACSVFGSWGGRLMRDVGTLLEALPYIREFHGRTVVIKIGGAAMTDAGLTHDFAQDIVLLRYVGLHPI